MEKMYIRQFLINLYEKFIYRNYYIIYFDNAIFLTKKSNIKIKDLIKIRYRIMQEIKIDYKINSYYQINRYIVPTSMIRKLHKINIIKYNKELYNRLVLDNF